VGWDRADARTWVRRLAAVIVTVWALSGPHTSVLTGAILVWLAVVVLRRCAVSPPWRRLQPPTSGVVHAADPAAVLHDEIARRGGGVYLGTGRDGRWRLAPRERAVLVLGPPRSGKSSSVMIPALLSHPGAAVSASTKPDVLNATIAARSGVGEVWRFDPTGAAGGADAQALRWSPVPASSSWDGALLMARSMVAGSGAGLGTTDTTHWAKRATALLAALLHAAAVDEAGMTTVLDWVLGHELDEPGVALDRAGARRGCAVLAGLQATEGRERSSICSAAADAVDAYTSDQALATATDPNFNADAFVRGRDTIYVHAPAERQALAAPLVCGLLADVRRATYEAHHVGQMLWRVLFALDEVANIAPLAELPAIASEGGGQGLTLLAALQDLSQARARWGDAVDGFLTLFGAKLILGGVADARTLEAVSVALGEYDRRVVSRSRRPSRQWLVPEHTRTVSTQRQRVLSPGEVANLPAGHALRLDGVRWELVELTPAYRCEPWRTLSELPRVSRDTAPAAEAAR
jgi:type IV secretory pathway TraG/TraD family ATPase VirD4